MKKFSFSFSISIALIKSFPFVLIAIGRNRYPFGSAASYARSWIGDTDWMDTDFAKEVLQNAQRKDKK